MKTIYAIRDRIANDLAGYFPLVVFRTDAQAVRYFADSIGSEKSALAAHPADYELVRCGTVQDDGELSPVQGQRPQVVITGDALIAASTPQPVKEA